jgi:ComF family protein
MRWQASIILNPYLIIREYLQGFVHLFYPHICLQCGMDELRKEQIICDVCETNLPYTHFGIIQDNPIQKIFWGRLSIDNAVAILFFTKESIVQKIIFELKYKQNKKAGYLLGKLLANELSNNPKFAAVDFLIPIPISKRKIKKRGYNQSLLICEAIVANGYAVAIFNGLIKSKNVATQTLKDRLERATQPNAVFSLNKLSQLKGKHLLIIDDVITTGATLEAACNCLILAKPASLNIASAAYTYH